MEDGGMEGVWKEYGRSIGINLNGIYRVDVTQTDTGIIVCFIDTDSGAPYNSRAVSATKMRLRPRT